MTLGCFLEFLQDVNPTNKIKMTVSGLNKNEIRTGYLGNVKCGGTHVDFYDTCNSDHECHPYTVEELINKLKEYQIKALDYQIRIDNGEWDKSQSNLLFFDNIVNEHEKVVLLTSEFAADEDRKVDEIQGAIDDISDLYGEENIMEIVRLLQEYGYSEKYLLDHVELISENITEVKEAITIVYEIEKEG